MSEELTDRLVEYFTDRTGDSLRSVVRYDHPTFEVAYVRDDVAGQYAADELAEAVDDSQMESLAASIYEGTFSADHGELTCLVKCFENVVEMNFVLDDGVGTAVALDEDALAETRDLVADAREIVVAERA